jgi:hypothetical protein
MLDGDCRVVEVYPSLWNKEYPLQGRTPDQHDAYSAACWMRRCDLDGSLPNFFKPYLIPNERPVAEIEGWILGIK